MREFIPNGPHIPEEVLEAHAEDNLIFFCGAGVSMYAGLPSFQGLVEYAFEYCGIPLEGMPLSAIESSQLDRALHFLERDAVKGQMRKSVIKKLNIKKKIKDLNTHSAILSLSKTKNKNKPRLVTTNFDTLFEKSVKNKPLVHSASAIPIPKHGRWNSLVYLHGRIDEIDDPDGKNLILTSADFGRAYLSEGWAAQFVVELFRGFTVLFVGYSLNDPVMSYLVDALCSQEEKGFNTPYILYCYDGDLNSREVVVQEWAARGVTAIPYLGSIEDEYPHFMLHETLRKWADEHRKGLTGRKSIAITGTASPFTGDVQKAKSIHWAIQNEPIAKAFSEADPSPHISWLKPLEKAEDQITNKTKRNQIISPLFSSSNQLSGVSRYFISWLVNHLSTKELCTWVSEKHGKLHEDFKFDILRTLDGTEVAEPYRLFWEIVCSDYILKNSTERDAQFLFRIDQVKNYTSNDMVLSECILKMIEPCLSVFPSNIDLYKAMFNEEVGKPETLLDLAKFTPSVRYDHIFHMLKPGLALEELLIANGLRLTGILEQAACLERMALLNNSFGGAFHSLISISDHPKNKHLDDWEKIVLLCRKSYDICKVRNPQTGQAIFNIWLSLWVNNGFEIFGRLSLYAATTNLKIGVSVFLSHFKSSNDLWTYAYKRELCQFLRVRATTFTNKQLEDIVKIILSGPSANFWRKDIKQSEIKKRTKKYISRLLSKLAQGGVSIKNLKSIDLRVSKYDISLQTFDDDSDELLFSHGDAEFRSPYRADDILNLSAKDFVDYIFNPQEKNDIFYDPKDYKRDMLISCGEKAQVNKIKAVANVLLARREKELCKHIFEGLNRINDPDKHKILLQKFAHSNALSATLKTSPLAVARWLEKASEVIGNLPENSIFWHIWGKCWKASAVKQQPDLKDFSTDPLGSGLNSSAGALANTLLYQLGKNKLTVGGGFPEYLADEFDITVAETKPCNLAALSQYTLRLRWLHAINPDWVRLHIIPRMKPGEPYYIQLWRCFLFGLSLSTTLTEDLKPYIFDVLMNAEKFSERNIYSLIALLAVYSPDILQPKQFRTILSKLPTDGLSTCLDHLRRILSSVKDEPEIVWKESILPWLRDCWPRLKNLSDDKTIEAFARLALSTKSEFPNAVSELIDAGFLGKIDNKHMGIFYREKKDEGYSYIKNHPKSYLRFATVIIGPDRDFQQGKIYGLREVLDKLVEADPGLAETDDLKILRGE